MKNLDERLQALPEIAEETGVTADEKLRQRILHAAQAPKTPRMPARKWAPALCCALALIVGLSALTLPRLSSSTLPQATNAPLIDSQPAGDTTAAFDVRALDVPTGSISIKKSSNPSYRSIWAAASGGNFPLVGVQGRYYRMLTNPTSVSADLLGDSLGTVSQYTSEPALAGKSGICSNTVAEGEAVYAVRGMKGAIVAANVNGKTRVFQRVSFGDSALLGGESLADTLKANNVVALEISGVGTINDAETAKRLMRTLTDNASFLRAGSSETNCSLLIQLRSGLVLQMAVNGERIMACGTWACPEFFEAFQEALQ